MNEEEELDGCDIDFNETIVDNPELFALFPDGKDEQLEAEYRELFND